MFLSQHATTVNMVVELSVAGCNANSLAANANQVVNFSIVIQMALMTHVSLSSVLHVLLAAGSLSHTQTLLEHKHMIELAKSII